MRFVFLIFLFGSIAKGSEIVTDSESDWTSVGSISEDLEDYEYSTRSCLLSIINRSGFDPPLHESVQTEIDEFYHIARTLLVNHELERFNRMSILQNGINNKLNSRNRGYHCNRIDLIPCRDMIISDLSEVMHLVVNMIPNENENENDQL